MMNYAERFQAYRDARRAFAVRVFALAIVFILMAITQWLLVHFVDPIRETLAKNFYITYIVFLCAMLTITVFICFERVRFIVPLNWILTIFIVECVIWGLAIVVVIYPLDRFGYSLLATMLFTIVLITIASCIPCDLTRHIVLLMMGALVLIFATIIFILIDIFSDVGFAAYIYLTIAATIMIIFLIYHVQTVLGGRYAEFSMNDFLLAALIIFEDFVILFILTFHLASKIDN